VSSFQEAKPVFDTRYIRQDSINLDRVKQSMDSNIYGYDSIKKCILKILKAGIEKPDSKKVNLLLTGTKATGKTSIFKAMIEGIGEEYCVFYDASMSTRVGLLDHLYTFKDRLDSIRYIVFDEIDKMSKTHQFGILNCVESGIMQETKFRRHRQVDVRGSTFFGTSNEILKVYSPLRSRFMVIETDPYTAEQFDMIGMKILKKMGFMSSFAEDIMKAIDTELKDKTIRDVVRFGTLVNNSADIKDLTELFKQHRLDFD